MVKNKVFEKYKYTVNGKQGNYKSNESMREIKIDFIHNNAGRNYTGDMSDYVHFTGGKLYSHVGIVRLFTGLHDKNGKEIYEGDIIATKFYPKWVERVSWKGDPDAIAEVYWDFKGFGLKAKGKKDFRYPELYEVNFKHTEVIGNIYESNPLQVE